MDKHESNRLAWNEAAEAYWKDLDKDTEFLSRGGISLCEPELKLLKNLGSWCKLAVHLQCAGGTDTLSLINLGAEKVLGVDISEQMLAVAQAKSDRLGMNAEWKRSDILSLPSELNSKADLVYTGQGAINWIMDIQAWARVVHRILRPGGRFVLFDGHPITFMFDPSSDKLAFDPLFEGYFSKKVYKNQGWPETYVGSLKLPDSEQSFKYERAWPVSEVINALIGAGLTLKSFEEYPDSYWDEFPHLPEDERRKFPNTFSLEMLR